MSFARSAAGVAIAAVFACACTAGGAGRDVPAVRIAPAGLEASARVVAAWIVDATATHAPAAANGARARLRVDASDPYAAAFAARLSTALLATGRVLLAAEREDVLVRLLDRPDDSPGAVEVRLEIPPGAPVARLLAAPERE